MYFEGNSFLIQERHKLKNNRFAKQLDGLCYLKIVKLSSYIANIMCNNVLWHLKLRKSSSDRIKCTNKRYDYIYVLEHFAYDLCHMIRYKKLYFPVSSFNVNNVFDLMYLDIWDDFSATSVHGFKYYLVVLYYHSRHFWLEKIKFKPKVSNYVRSFVSMVKTQFVKKIYVIRSDNG